MKLTDLMIGDLVMCTYPSINRPARVEELKILYDGELRIMIFDDVPLAFASRYVEPIPLTRDLLLANGFTCHSIFCYVSEDGRITLDPSIHNSTRQWYAHVDNEDYQTIASCDLDYLHQLQNLLTICGIEINWKL